MRCDRVRVPAKMGCRRKRFSWLGAKASLTSNSLPAGGTVGTIPKDIARASCPRNCRCCRNVNATLARMSAAAMTAAGRELSLGDRGQIEAGPDFGKELVGAERLCQDTIRAERADNLEEIDLAALEIAGHRQDLGRGFELADLHHRLDAVLLRHDDLGDDQIRPRVSPKPHPFDAVDGGKHMVAGALQRALDNAANAAVVVDDQYTGFHEITSPSAACHSQRSSHGAARGECVVWVARNGPMRTQKAQFSGKLSVSAAGVAALRHAQKNLPHDRGIAGQGGRLGGGPDGRNIVAMSRDETSKRGKSQAVSRRIWLKYRAYSRHLQGSRMRPADAHASPRRRGRGGWPRAPGRRCLGAA